VSKYEKIVYNICMMDIKWIIKSVQEEDYFFSQHADKERMNDNLLIAEIEESISAGSILESYEDDARGSSCLVVGFSKSGIPVHCVCGVSGDSLVIITVYIPTPPKFITPYERAKNEEL
jgi:hypothetical protein